MPLPPHAPQGVGERERAPADELPALAVGALVAAAALSGSDAGAAAHLLRALVMLEAAVATRKYAAPLRLALVALHTLLVGAGPGFRLVACDPAQEVIAAGQQQA